MMENPSDIDPTFQSCSDRCYDPNLSESGFRDMVASMFPEYVATNGIPYFLHSGYLMGSGCRITYISYDQRDEFDPGLRKFIDSMDDDYRICVFNFLYMLSRSEYLVIDKEWCELLVPRDTKADLRGDV